MKKRGSNTFLLLMVSLFCSVHAVMEEKFEPFKPEEKIQKPKTGKEAYELEERFERTRKELERDFKKDKDLTVKDIDEVIDKKNSLIEQVEGLSETKLENPEYYVEKINKLAEDREKLKQMKEAREYLNEPAIEKALQDFKAELTKSFEPVKPQEPEPAKKEETAKEKEAEQEAAKKQLEEEVKREDMPLGMGLWDALSLWYQKTKATVFEFFGFKEHALEVRNDINTLLEKVGSSGLLEKVRNNMKRMRVIETAEQKLKTGALALEDLQKAIEAKTIDSARAQEEIVGLVENLIALRQEIDISKIPHVDNLDKSIDTILAKFDIDEAKRNELLEKAQKKRTREIEQLRNEVQNSMFEAADTWIISNPEFDKEGKQLKQFSQYREKLNALVRRDISASPLSTQGDVNFTIREGFRQPVNALLEKIASDKPVTVKHRAALLDRFFSLHPDYVRSEKRVNDWYIKYAQDKGVPAPGVKDVLSSSYAQAVIGKNIKPVVEAVIKNVGNEELQSAYRELDRMTATYVDFLKKKPVSEGSLNSLVTLIDAYGNVIDSIGKLSSVSEEQVGKVTNVFVEATDTVQKLIDDLQTAQVSTIGVSNNQPVITIPAPPPLPPAEVENNARKVVAQLPKGDLMQEMLNAKLKKATPNIKQKVEEGGLYSAFEKAMKQKGLLTTPSEAGPEASEIDWD